MVAVVLAFFRDQGLIKQQVLFVQAESKEEALFKVSLYGPNRGSHVFDARVLGWRDK